MTPACPICGASMRQTRRGATLERRGPAFVCPNDERELAKDAAGRLSRTPDARHPYLRAWEPHELELTP